jgi:hypothetical protein
MTLVPIYKKCFNPFIDIRAELNHKKPMTYKNFLIENDFIRFLKISPVVETEITFLFILHFSLI